MRMLVVAAGLAGLVASTSPAAAAATFTESDYVGFQQAQQSARALSWSCETNLRAGRWGGECDRYREAIGFYGTLLEALGAWCADTVGHAPKDADGKLPVPAACGAFNEPDPVRMDVLKPLIAKVRR